MGLPKVREVFIYKILGAITGVRQAARHNGTRRCEGYITAGALAQVRLWV
ncbi:hypothetical protein R50076_33560 [Gilvimarinus japonicus]